MERASIPSASTFSILIFSCSTNCSSVRKSDLRSSVLARKEGRSIVCRPAREQAEERERASRSLRKPFPVEQREEKGRDSQTKERTVFTWDSRESRAPWASEAFADGEPLGKTYVWCQDVKQWRCSLRWTLLLTDHDATATYSIVVNEEESCCVTISLVHFPSAPTLLPPCLSQTISPSGRKGIEGDSPNFARKWISASPFGSLTLYSVVGAFPANL